MIRNARIAVAALSVSMAGFVGIVMHEGWMGTAAPPVAGDVDTYGFGSTIGPDGKPVSAGDKITPPAAVALAARDVRRFESAIKQCVRVELYQHEYDAYTSLAYNIGQSAFCGSTLVRKLNARDYAGACSEVLRWDKFQGKPLKGLTIRRQSEYKQCMGGVQ